MTGSTAARIRVLALLDERFGVGGEAHDWPVEPLGRVDGMRQQVAGHARAGHAGVEPPERQPALRHLGCNRVVLVVNGEVMEGPPNAPLADDLLGQRNGRHAAVVERDHVGHARPLYRGGHFLGLAGIHGQRLFADDHLSRFGRGNHHVMVQDVRHAHVHQVDIGPLDQLAPIEFRQLVAPVFGEPSSLSFLPAGRNRPSKPACARSERNGRLAARRLNGRGP